MDFKLRDDFSYKKVVKKVHPQQKKDCREDGDPDLHPTTGRTRCNDKIW